MVTCGFKNLKYNFFFNKNFEAIAIIINNKLDFLSFLIKKN